MCYTLNDHKFIYDRIENNKRIFKCIKCGKESKSNIKIDLQIMFKRRKIDNEHIMFSKIS